MTPRKGKLSNFRPQSKNANKHTERGLGLLEKSISKNGWIGAMTAASDGEIFDGSARLETVAGALPEDPIIVETDGKRPVIIKRTDIKKATDPRAVRLALEANRIQEIDLDWDIDILGEIAEKKKQLLDGLFTDVELGKLGVELEDESKDAEPQIDRAGELLKKWKVKTGDLWQIGEHRLICGDCTDAGVVGRVMGGERVDMIITDPPYGVDYEYINYKDIKENHQHFLDLVWGALPEYKMMVLTPGHSHLPWFFSKNPHSIMVWFDKTKQSPSKAAFLNKFDIILIYGKVFKRYKWDVFEVQGMRGDGLRELHTCPKPVELFEMIISEQDEAKIVYEPFSGSGTTLVACQNLNRRGRAIEISPAYCAVALQRMQDAFPGIDIKRIK